jgi:4,5-dihydroxyphthalate decarboxylase
MAQLPVSVCFWNYDRTMPMADGRVQIEGCDAAFHIRRPEDAFHRAFYHAEYDITELSFSRFMARYAEDDVAYDVIPVFPSRAFRHGSLFVRSDRGIETPADLKGKTLGLLDFEMTAALVARGMLSDDYDVAPQDISWVVGPVEDDGGHIPQGASKSTREGVEISLAPEGRSLNALLADGHIDGIIGLYEPTCMADGAPVKRLFADWRSTEQDYFRRTGIFPIMHTVAIRKTLLAENPWLARAVYKAFCDAKDIAIAELQVPQACKVTLPWVVAEYAATSDIMGSDIWPYGFAANRGVIEAMIRWSQNDGLLARNLTADELFVPEMLET